MMHPLLTSTALGRQVMNDEEAAGGGDQRSQADQQGKPSLARPRRFNGQLHDLEFSGRHASLINVR